MADPDSFRSSRAAMLGVVVLAVCTIPLAFAAPALRILLVLPLLAAVYVLRTGTSADRGGLTITTVRERRTVTWDDVDRLEGRKGGVYVLTRSGEATKLPGVTRTDVPRVVRASGGRLAGADDPAPPRQTSDPAADGAAGRPEHDSVTG